MKKLILISCTNPYGDKCSLFHYKNELGLELFFRDTNIPFEYLLLENSNMVFKDIKLFKKIITEFTDKGLSQHDFVGGYFEAIQILTIN